jgi:hypothetical protein
MTGHSIAKLQGCIEALRDDPDDHKDFEDYDDGWKDACNAVLEVLSREHDQSSLVERLPELRGRFERILNIARCHSRRTVGNIELADRLIDAVVAWADG